jgi:hypothetical protein
VGVKRGRVLIGRVTSEVEVSNNEPQTGEHGGEGVDFIKKSIRERVVRRTVNVGDGE